MKNRKYNFFNILDVEVHTNRLDYLRYFENEFACLPKDNSTKINTMVIRLFIVGKIPKREKTDIHKSLKFKNLFNVEYLIRNIESKNVSIYFSGNIIDRLYVKAISVFAQTELLEPIMYAKFLESNIILMHSAGVSKGQDGYIFPAHGGTGKTTLSLALCRKGFALLGDDLLIVDPAKQLVYPYPRPLHLFTYNINTLQDAEIKWTLKCVIKSKDLIRAILGAISKRELLISTRVHVKTIYPNIRISGKSNIKKLIFLIRSGESYRVDLLEREDILKRTVCDICESADLNNTLYNDILPNNEYRSSLISLESLLVTNLLSKYPNMDYVNTRTTDVDKMIDIIEGHNEVQ